MPTNEPRRHLGPRQLDIQAYAIAHLHQYLETNGEEEYQGGTETWGMPSLILTTTGRRTGKPYSTPLYFGEHSGRYILVGSFGGSTAHPDWYLNLLDDPRVQVQIRAECFDARARPATADERPELWAFMAALYPNYDLYQSETEREIPVVIVERV
jgi:deazaflavin-dependent oxidoreductase (nitroreductase family)